MRRAGNHQYMKSHHIINFFTRIPSQQLQHSALFSAKIATVTLQFAPFLRLLQHRLPAGNFTSKLKHISVHFLAAQCYCAATVMQKKRAICVFFNAKKRLILLHMETTQARRNNNAVASNKLYPSHHARPVPVILLIPATRCLSGLFYFFIIDR
jgi:hypothetical protein